MADNNSDPSFLDKVKGFPNTAANQVKQDFAQVMQNRSDREAILSREKNSNALTASQKEQLSNISNAGDAQKFVDASILGNENGDYNAGQSVYKDSLSSSGKAWGSLAVNAAELYAGGAVAKGIFSGASKLLSSAFKGSKVAERIEPTMGKAFESEYSAAQKAKREAESIARNQENGGYWKNKQGKGSSTFNTNTERAAQAEKKAADDGFESLKADQNRNPFNRTPRTTPEAETPSNERSWLGKIGMSFAKTAAKGVVGYGALLGGAMGVQKVSGDYLDKRSREQLPDDIEGSQYDTKIKNPENFEDSPVYDEPTNSGENVDTSELGDVASKLGGAALGAYIGSGYKSPFKGMSGLVSGVGSLFPSGNSAESTLSSMPSGGDSGTTGEGGFREGDMAGKTVLEVLNKIHSTLGITKNITEGIAKDVSILVKSQGQQDAARDLSSENLRARQNEGGTASPIFAGGGGRDDSDDSSSKKEKEEGGILGALKSIGGIALKTLSKYKFPAAVAAGVGASMFLGNKAEASVKDPTASIFKQNGNTGYSSTPIDIHGVDDEYMKNIALIESGGKTDAKPSTSSAQGLYQFTAGTWKDTVKAMGKQYTLADRNDPKKAEEVMRFFTAKNQQLFKQNTGRLPTNKESYMSHFLGATGASNFANANPNASAANVNPSAAKSNYNIFYDKKTGRKRTVGEVTNIMGGRYDQGVAALKSGKWGKNGIPDTIRNIGSNQTETPTKDTGTVITVDGNKNELPPSPDHFEKNENDPNLKVSFNDTNKASPMDAEVQEVDNQRAVLQEERDKLSRVQPNGEKDMAAQLDRLHDIHTEMSALSERRNAVTGSPEYLANIENKKSGGMQQASLQQPQQQTSQSTRQHPSPKGRAGASSTVPKVRNDDPTLKLLEENNFHLATTHAA